MPISLQYKAKMREIMRWIAFLLKVPYDLSSTFIHLYNCVLCHGPFDEVNGRSHGGIVDHPVKLSCGRESRITSTKVIHNS